MEDDLELELSPIPISNYIVATPPMQQQHSNNDVALEHMISKLEKDGCQLCSLGIVSPKVVVSRGNLRSRIAIVGQNPGTVELQQGYPFLGPAGKLLDSMLEKSGLDKAKPYFTNVGLCGTPENRPLNEQEQAKCKPHLTGQLLLLRPKVILAVGKPAISTIDPTSMNVKVSDIISKIWSYDNKFETVPVYVIYHLAFILRQQNQQEYIDITVDTMKRIVDLLKSIPMPTTLF